MQKKEHQWDIAVILTLVDSDIASSDVATGDITVHGRNVNLECIGSAKLAESIELHNEADYLSIVQNSCPSERDMIPFNPQ